MDTNKRLKVIATILSITVFLIGFVVFVGWVFNVSLLKSVFPNMVSMKVNTAICFMLAGISLITYYQINKENHWHGNIIKLCSLGIIFIGFITFCEYIFGINLAIDQFLFKDSTSAILTSSPGRMAFNTSINFIFIGIALFLISYRKIIHEGVVQALAIVVGSMGLVSLLGYIFEADPLILGLNFSTAMALHTTIAFIFCSIPLILATSSGLMDIISGDYLASRVFRKIYLIVILVPLILGWIETKIHDLGTMDLGMIKSLTVIIGIYFTLVFIFIFSFSAKREEEKSNVLNKKLLEESEKLSQSRKILEETLAESKRLNNLMVGRELEMIRLKREIDRLNGNK